MQPRLPSWRRSATHHRPVAERRTTVDADFMPRLCLTDRARHSLTPRAGPLRAGCGGPRRSARRSAAHRGSRAARARQVDLDRRVSTRPGRGDITTIRSDRKTASAMLCVTNTSVVAVSDQTFSSSRFSRSRVISSSAPNGSSISSTDGRNESALAMLTRCCIPPDSSHGYRRANSSRPDQLQQLLGPRSAARPSATFITSSGSWTFCSHRPPVVQDRLLEDDAVVARQPGLAGRLAVDQQRPRGRREQVADQPQQRALAAAGRPDQRDQLAPADLQADVVERAHQSLGAGLAEHHRDAARSRSPRRARDPCRSTAAVVVAVIGLQDLACRSVYRPPAGRCATVCHHVPLQQHLPSGGRNGGPPNEGRSPFASRLRPLPSRAPELPPLTLSRR